MVRKTIVALVLLCTPFFQIYSNDWYSEYWQRFFWKMWECGPFSLGTYADIKTGNHLKNVRFLEFSEQLFYKASEDFSLEFHYTYIHSRSVVADSPWKWQHRLEFEGNRTFHLPGKNLIQTRNRFEIRKIQNTPKIQYRLRQQTMLVVPIENCGRLKSFSIFNELFYNLSTHLFNQDRICPCQLTFALSEKADLEVFFLVRFFLKNDIWLRSAVFGSQLKF